jgi:hypothetical protein
VFARRNTLWIVVVLVAISLDSCRHDVPVRARRPAAEGPVTLVASAEHRVPRTPGNQDQGMIDLPIDLAHDSYRATCHEAMWHGAPPI